MNRFDSLFFSQYLGPDDTIVDVFHRHFFVILEDIILWIFFAVLIPVFLYYYNVFDIQSGISGMYFGLYLLMIYGIIMYKVFDWYADVWVATDTTIIDVKWKWFTANLLYIAYDKIEGIEVRTHSWITALIGMSDVVIKLAGNESFSLMSARSPTALIAFLQEKTQGKKHGSHEEDKEPFELLLDTLTGVVKGHLTTHGKEYITRDYVSKLDDTLIRGKPIDLRTQEEKVLIQNWKEKYTKKEDHHEDAHEDSHEHH